MAGLSQAAVVGLALGVGIGSLLILVACVILWLRIRKRRNGSLELLDSGEPNPPDTLAAGSRCDSEPATLATVSDAQAHTSGLVLGRGQPESLQHTFCESAALPKPSASAISTALDLLSDSVGLFGPEVDVDGPGVSDGLSSFSDRGASTLRHCATDSAHTMHLRKHPAACRNSSTQAHKEGDVLWKRGVDPADVEIHRDARGQPVVLGRGAYAVVYLGRWHATLVAVKVMLSAESEAAQQDMRAEADILRGLRHPHVVLLMAVCIAPNQQVCFACVSCTRFRM